MKKNFTAPKLNIELFISDDVITTSGITAVTAVDNVTGKMSGEVDPSNIKIFDWVFNS